MNSPSSRYRELPASSAPAANRKLTGLREAYRAYRMERAALLGGFSLCLLCLLGGTIAFWPRGAAPTAPLPEIADRSESAPAPSLSDAPLGVCRRLAIGCSDG